MNARDLKNLKPGDKIKWKKGCINAGLHEIVIRVVPSTNDLRDVLGRKVYLDKIEVETSDGIRAVPHDRFTKD